MSTGTFQLRYELEGQHPISIETLESLPGRVFPFVTTDGTPLGEALLRVVVLRRVEEEPVVDLSFEAQDDLCRVVRSLGKDGALLWPTTADDDFDED